MTKLAPTPAGVFIDRLMGQRQASRHTIAGYRDTCRLLLGFATVHVEIHPVDVLDLEDHMIGQDISDSAR